MHPRLPSRLLETADSNWRRDIAQYVPVLGVWIMVVTLLRGIGGALFSAFRIGLDEDFELTKGWLWAVGIPLYDPLWNDQPPLLTVLLGSLFRMFGPEITVARSAALGFGLALWAGTTVLVGRLAGPFAAAVATFALISAPGVFFLSLSVMLEVPAFALALWALWPLHRWQDAVAAPPPSEHGEHGRAGAAVGHPADPSCWSRFVERLPAWHWPLLSGLLLALALQIKLTAAIAAPALMIEWWFGTATPKHLHEPRLRMKMLGVWTTSLCGGYAGLALLIGHIPPSVLWDTHFSSAVRGASADDPNAFPHWCFQRDYTDVLLSAGLALLVLVGQRRWGVLRFPLTWLVTAVVVHSLHRPWWQHYFLHFAVPLAWLTGAGVAALFQLARGALANERQSQHRWGILWLWGAAGLLGALLTWGGERLWQQALWICHLPRADESGLVAQMRRYAAHTRWVFTRETIVAFHAGVRVIPELAVLPSKRFWSGQVNQEQIWEIVRRYLPDQLLLTDADLTLEARFFVERHYDTVFQEGAYQLFVRKGLSSFEL